MPQDKSTLIDVSHVVEHGMITYKARARLAQDSGVQPSYNNSVVRTAPAQALSSHIGYTW